MDDAGDGTPACASLRHGLGHRARVADVHGQIASLAAGVADGLQGAADLTDRDDGGHPAPQLGRLALSPRALVSTSSTRLSSASLSMPWQQAGSSSIGVRPSKRKRQRAARAQFDHTGSGHAARPARDHHHRMRIERQGRACRQRRRNCLQDHPGSLDRKTHFALDPARRSSAHKASATSSGERPTRPTSMARTCADGHSIAAVSRQGRGTCQPRALRAGQAEVAASILHGHEGSAFLGKTGCHRPGRAQGFAVHCHLVLDTPGGAQAARKMTASASAGTS